MSEEIDVIKYCDNCEALGIYEGNFYCCLSHRNDILPNNLTCEDFYPKPIYKQLQLEKDNVAELNELLISYKEENEKLKQGVKVSMEWTSDCCKVCTFKEENEKLKEDLQEETRLGHRAMCDEADVAYELMIAEQKLEKIEDYCKNKTLSYCDCSKEILQIIEGDNNE